MACDLALRPALPSDASDISALILSQLHHRTPRPDAPPPPAAFLQGFAPETIRASIESGRCRYLVAHVGDLLVGALGLRVGDRHLLHLFVAGSHQHAGIARALWERALAELRLAVTGPVAVTVNSSLYAVPVYERFGFTVQGPPVERPGVVFVPMRFEGRSV